MTYDSSKDTLEHIRKVNELLLDFAMEILERAKNHDNSKLFFPEKEAFDEVTPMLKDLTYGSKEYIDSIKKIQPAIDHHRNINFHHPEFYKEGIDGMTLVDLVEMVFDWKAASERHTDGNVFKSLDINKNRFNLSDQLYKIIYNTLEKFREE